MGASGARRDGPDSVPRRSPDLEIAQVEAETASPNLKLRC
jgi:hypothetical protein